MDGKSRSLGCLPGGSRFRLQVSPFLMEGAGVSVLLYFVRSWAIPTMSFAQSHYRSIQRFYIADSYRAQGNLNACREFFKEAKADLSWWVQNLNAANGKQLLPKIPDVEIYSDTSL